MPLLRLSIVTNLRERVRKSTFQRAEYVQALLDDLEADLSYVQGREIQTIFIGGGTPSLLSVEAL